MCTRKVKTHIEPRTVESRLPSPWGCKVTPTLDTNPLFTGPGAKPPFSSEPPRLPLLYGTLLSPLRPDTTPSPQSPGPSLFLFFPPAPPDPFRPRVSRPVLTKAFGESGILGSGPCDFQTPLKDKPTSPLPPTQDVNPD